ncbi:hypothetical protein BCR43DRAFT_350049 [Syncephalastrum racemosum]|uniref:Uncharacterized protein n=1 Tax=Syncephalastrum racemosum TaxID=13706 RepID=A0A1X2H641_SYNRA|nr:hypothetical protein BCR43DRAFT_350049 [Syncephalastrum racemosum]
MALKQEKADLQAQLEQLKREYSEKSQLLNENENHLKESDINLRSELDSLRAILLAKIGDVEGREQEETPRISEIVPACEALEMLENQAKDYIYALREQTTLKGLPYEIAAKLKVAADTWSEETKKLAQMLEDTKGNNK